MATKTDWKFVRWDFVKSIANNDFTRVVGLIPIAGYLILFNDEIVRMASFDALASVAEGDKSPFLIGGLIKLRLVFFGSLFVLLSFVIYRVFRPEVLDVAKSDLEFSDFVRRNYSVHDLAQLEQKVHSDGWVERTDAFWIVLGHKRPKKSLVSGYRFDVRAAMFTEHGDYIALLAREWWIGAVHSFRAARISSLLFGILGYLFLAVPTLDIAQAVLRSLLPF